MSMSNVSQTRGNIEKPFIRALFRMPKQLLFLLLHFGLRNHQAIYFFCANRYMPTCTMIPVSRLRYIVWNFSICERNVGNCIIYTDISWITSTPVHFQYLYELIIQKIDNILIEIKNIFFHFCLFIKNLLVC